MVVHIIRDIEHGNKRIWGKVVYNLSYEHSTKKYTCECDMFVFKGKCKHIEEFKKIVGDLIGKDKL